MRIITFMTNFTAGPSSPLYKEQGVNVVRILSLQIEKQFPWFDAKKMLGGGEGGGGNDSSSSSSSAKRSEKLRIKKHNLTPEKPQIIPTRQPLKSDHIYAFFGPKALADLGMNASSSSSNSTRRVNPSPFKSENDPRQCRLCAIYGEGQPADEGRLLYAGQDDWVHANCVLWSAGVYEDGGGGLLFSASFLKDAKNAICDCCREPGASVNCNDSSCDAAYHFMCARLTGCAFMLGLHCAKRVLCPSHVISLESSSERHEEVVKDFVNRRRLFINLRAMTDDRLKKSWKGGISPDQLSLVVGETFTFFVLTVSRHYSIYRVGSAKNFLATF